MTSTMSRERAKTMLFSPSLVADRTIRVVWDRAEARMPRSGLMTGGFHSNSRRSPWGASLRFKIFTGSPISIWASSRGLAMVAEAKINLGVTP
jgi:hypothetical protein